MEKQYKSWIDIISKCVTKPLDKPLLKAAIFGFKFPVSFSAQESFLTDQPQATAQALFLKDNVAKIIRTDSEIETSWLGAYNKIAISSFGKKVIPSPPDVSGLYLRLEKKYALVWKWIETFNLIPMVKAEPALSENHLIQVGLPIPSPLFKVRNKKRKNMSMAFICPRMEPVGGIIIPTVSCGRNIFPKSSKKKADHGKIV